MRNGNPLLLGAGRYIQSENALATIGSEVRNLGRRAFILGGETALSLTLDTMKASLDDEHKVYSIRQFKGSCSESQVSSIAEAAKIFGADFIIGVGGGKCLDTAKAVADILDRRIVTVPTTAATCAAYSILSVMYSDNGSVLGNMFHKQEVAAVIVDTHIVVKKCPIRMVASGIGDALAKFPELIYSKNKTFKREHSVLPSVAVDIAKQTSRILMKIGAKAISDASSYKDSQNIEDTVCTNIALTGIISALVGCGRQLALAHDFYNSICANFIDHRERYMHGELVAVAIPFQMAVNGSTNKEIDAVKTFLHSINVPASFEDIRLESSEKNVQTILSHIFTSNGLQDEISRHFIRTCMETIL